MEILTVKDRKQKKFLKKKTKAFDFSAMKKKDVHKLVREMREAMREADGMGLAGNQVGIDAQMFVAELDNKPYAIFNPEIIERSVETFPLDEGCLSIPGETVEVNRSEEVVIRGFDRNGKRVKIKANGLLAAVFQHETDHLTGTLITDYKK